MIRTTFECTLFNLPVIWLLFVVLDGKTCPLTISSLIYGHTRIVTICESIRGFRFESGHFENAWSNFFATIQRFSLALKVDFNLNFHGLNLPTFLFNSVFWISFSYYLSSAYHRKLSSTAYHCSCFEHLSSEQWIPTKLGTHDMAPSIEKPNLKCFACFTLIYAICMEISAFTSPSVACLLNMLQ